MLANACNGNRQKKTKRLYFEMIVQSHSKSTYLSLVIVDFLVLVESTQGRLSRISWSGSIHGHLDLYLQIFGIQLQIAKDLGLGLLKATVLSRE